MVVEKTLGRLGTYSTILFPLAGFVPAIWLGAWLEYIGVGMWLIPAGLAIAAFIVRVYVLAEKHHLFRGLAALSISMMLVTALTSYAREETALAGKVDRLTYIVSHSEVLGAQWLKSSNDDVLKSARDRIPQQVDAEFTRRAAWEATARRNQEAEELARRERQERINETLMPIMFVLWILGFIEPAR